MEKLNGLDTSEDDLTPDEKNEELAKYYDSLAEKDKEEETKPLCRKPTAKKFIFSADEIKELLIKSGCNLEGYELEYLYRNNNNEALPFYSLTFEAVLDD